MNRPETGSSEEQEPAWFLGRHFTFQLCDKYFVDADLAEARELDSGIFWAWLGYDRFVLPYENLEHQDIRDELGRVAKCVAELEEALGNLSVASRWAMFYAGDTIPWCAPREEWKAIRPRAPQPLNRELTERARSLRDDKGEVPLSAQELKECLRPFNEKVSQALDGLACGSGRQRKQGGIDLLYEALAEVFRYFLLESAYPEDLGYKVERSSDGARDTWHNPAVQECAKFISDILSRLQELDYLPTDAVFSEDSLPSGVRTSLRAIMQRKVNASETLYQLLFEHFTR